MTEEAITQNFFGKSLAEVAKSEMKKKYYCIIISYEDPYPKQWKSAPIQARSHGRAIDFATRAFKKTRPKKHEVKIINVRSERL